MSELRSKMTQDLDLAGLAVRTKQIYLSSIRDLAVFFMRSPQDLNQDALRLWVRHLKATKISSQRLRQHFAALRFLYGKTLGRPEQVAFLSWPKDPDRLPLVLSAGQIQKLPRHVGKQAESDVTACPAPAGRTRFDIADIVRRHRAEFEARVHLTDAQRRVLSAIALCRTAALGGHMDVCRSCGFERPSFNSCLMGTLP